MEASFVIGFWQCFSGKKCLLAFLGFTVLLFAFFGMTADAFAHGVTVGDKGYIQETTGVLPVPFIYLGANHMMTGYDHLLFIACMRLICPCTFTNTMPVNASKVAPS